MTQKSKKKVKTQINKAAQVKFIKKMKTLKLITFKKIKTKIKLKRF